MKGIFGLGDLYTGCFTNVRGEIKWILSYGINIMPAPLKYIIKWKTKFKLIF